MFSDTKRHYFRLPHSDLANSTALPVCTKCGSHILETEVATACVACKGQFHLPCSGQTKVSVRFGCEFCYAKPGNAPQGRFGDEPAGPSRSPAPVQTDEHIRALIVSTISTFFENRVSEQTVPRTAQLSSPIGSRGAPQAQHTPFDGTPLHSAPPNPLPAAQSFQENRGDRESALNVTQARNSAEFMHYLGQPPPDLGPPSYARPAPPSLPKFDGSPKDWPMFISQFHESTQRHRVSNVDNMARLREALHGPAARVVEGSMLHASSLFQVLDTLRESFGDPSKVLHHLEQELVAAPKVDIHGKGLQLLSVKITSLVNVLEACGMEDQMRNQSLVNTLQEKLPFWLAMRWADFSDDQQYQHSGVSGFAAFLKREVSRALRVGQNQVRLTEAAAKRTVLTISHVPTAVSAPEVNESPPSAAGSPDQCPGCGQGHRLDKCPVFLNMDDPGRRVLVEKQRICFRCLRRGSRSHSCSARDRCRVNGCEFRHHPLVHGVCRLKFESTTPSTGVPTAPLPRPSFFFKIVPVVVSNGTKSIAVHALIDEASTLTLMDNSLAEELALEGPEDPLTMKWTDHHTNTNYSSRRVSCHIRGVEGVHALGDIATWNLDLPTQTLPAATLAELQIPAGSVSPYYDVRPRLLIGLPHAGLSMSLESHQCPRTGLISARTHLGWTLYGGRGGGPHLVGLHQFIGRRPAQDGDDVLEGLTVDSIVAQAHCHVSGSAEERRTSVTVGKIASSQPQSCLTTDRPQFIAIPNRREPPDSKAIQQLDLTFQRPLPSASRHPASRSPRAPEVKTPGLPPQWFRQLPGHSVNRSVDYRMKLRANWTSQHFKWYPQNVNTELPEPESHSARILRHGPICIDHPSDYGEGRCRPHAEHYQGYGTSSDKFRSTADYW